MGFFKSLFGQSDNQQEDNFDINDYLDDSDDYETDSDGDDLDLEDYSDDDGDNYSVSSEKSYSIAKVRVVGYDKQDEADKDYIRDRLEEGTHVYLRYDFESPNKQQALQVYRHSYLLGHIEPGKSEILHTYLREAKIGAIVVSKIKSKDFTHSIELKVYYEDPHGEEVLPYYPFEGRKLDVIEVDLWTGQEDWSKDWFMNIFTDELCYKYLNLYDGTVDENEIRNVDWQLVMWINRYLDGTCISRKGGELYINRLQTDCAKRVFVKRMESYLENKGLHFAEKELFSDDEETDNEEEDNTESPSVGGVVKQYIPTYEICYIDGQGKYQKRTIKNANMNSFIAGIKYRDNYEEMISKLSEGMEVQLKKDPDNPYDPDAIVVYNGGDHLGYIPKRDIPAIVLNMDNDCLAAEVDYVEDDNVDLIIPVSFERILQMTDDELDGFRFYKTERTKYETGYEENSSPISKEEFVEGIKLQSENNYD